MLLAQLMFQELYNKARQRLIRDDFRRRQVTALTAIPFSNLPYSSKLPPVASQTAIDQIDTQIAMTPPPPTQTTPQTQYQPTQQPRPQGAPAGSPASQSITSPYHRIPLGRGKITGVDEGMVGTPMTIQNGMQVLRPPRVLPQSYPDQRIVG